MELNVRSVTGQVEQRCNSTSELADLLASQLRRPSRYLSFTWIFVTPFSEVSVLLRKFTWSPISTETVVAFLQLAQQRIHRIICSSDDEVVQVDEQCNRVVVIAPNCGGFYTLVSIQLLATFLSSSGTIQKSSFSLSWKNSA